MLLWFNVCPTFIIATTPSFVNLKYLIAINFCLDLEFNFVGSLLVSVVMRRLFCFFEKKGTEKKNSKKKSGGKTLILQNLKIQDFIFQKNHF